MPYKCCQFFDGMQTKSVIRNDIVFAMKWERWWKTLKTDQCIGIHFVLSSSINTKGKVQEKEIYIYNNRYFLIIFNTTI